MDISNSNSTPAIVKQKNNATTAENHAKSLLVFYRQDNAVVLSNLCHACGSRKTVSIQGTKKTHSVINYSRFSIILFGVAVKRPQQKRTREDPLKCLITDFSLYVFS